jgi:hypothetical protein
VDNAAQNFALPRRIVMSLLRQEQHHWDMTEKQLSEGPRERCL